MFPRRRSNRPSLHQWILCRNPRRQKSLRALKRTLKFPAGRSLQLRGISRGVSHEVPPPSPRKLLPPSLETPPRLHVTPPPSRAIRSPSPAPPPHPCNAPGTLSPIQS